PLAPTVHSGAPGGRGVDGVVGDRGWRGGDEMVELEGRRALVTGAARGLGRAIAGLFIERGARVMLADTDEEEARRAAAELGDAARSVRCDVTSSADVKHAVQATVDAFGGLDVVVNNAGIEVVKPLVEQSEEEFSRL